MINKKFLALFIFTLLNTNSVIAYEQPLCADKVGQDINSCLLKEFDKADNELNKVYQQLIKVDSRHKKQLTTAELNWIKFRDTECTYQSLAYEGGTLAKTEYSICEINLTKERIKHLKHAISKFRG